MENKHTRIQSIDFLRGLVLILMLLDHSRIFFTNISAPLSLTDSTTWVFFTRWITHLCASAFIFLAGVSVYLYAYRAHHGKSQAAYFLLTRGIWFVFISATYIVFAWTFFMVPYTFYIEIFGVIGLSMICLAALIFLPLRLIGLISILMIITHNLLDPIGADSLSSTSWLWKLLHEPGSFSVFNLFEIEILYPLIPWVGVMGLGYYMGRIFILPESERRKSFLVIGLFLITAFIVLRYFNIYGDPASWVIQENGLLTVMSFLNVTKYPASLLFLLMTLGACFLILGSISEEFCKNKISQIIITFGRVPFFFYVIHLPFLFALALIALYFQEGSQALLSFYSNRTQHGYNIEIVYLVTGFALIILYYPCLWYGNLKARSKKWYFSYL